MANDYGVRQGLLGKGYSNDDIGYDQNTGYVQLKGQNFIKPEMNVQGTTYTSQDNFKNAYDQFSKQQRANQQQQFTDQYIQKSTQPPAANPYNDQYSQLINTIMQKVNAPQQDVYSTPQYAAAQAQQQRAAQQGIRSAQEALGTAGFGRSTALGESANRAQNDANEYLQLQMVPQIQQQLASQRQTEIANQTGLLNPIFNQLTRQDTQNDNANNRIRDVIDLLGSQKQTDFNNTRLTEADARQKQQDHMDLAKMLTEMYGVQVDPKDDPYYAYKQVEGLTPVDTQRQNLKDLWTVAEQTGTIPDQLATLYGLPKGTQTQAAKQFAMNHDLQTEKFHSDVDQSLLDYSQKEGQTPKGGSVSDISANINRGISSMGDSFDTSTPQGKQQIESMIITQTQDPKVAVPLYNMYGIPVPPQLQKEYEQSLKGNP